MHLIFLRFFQFKCFHLHIIISILKFLYITVHVDHMTGEVIVGVQSTAP